MSVAGTRCLTTEKCVVIVSTNSDGRKAPTDQMIFRSTNESCFTCGVQVPTDVNQEGQGAEEAYYCPDCGDRVLNGIVQRNGELRPSSLNVPPIVPVSVCQLPDDVNWQTWELWWIGSAYLSRINGRIIGGDEQFAEYVDKIHEIYDSD